MCDTNETRIISILDEHVRRKDEHQIDKINSPTLISRETNNVNHANFL